MKSIVLAEKPSVGRDLARVLNCTTRTKNYIEGEKYIVTWALGHLVELMEPNDYNPKWKRWDLKLLPMIPDEMKLKIMKKTSPQFNAIKRLFKRKDVDKLIIATDAGREGELVARWIIILGGWKNKPIKRLWISSQTSKAINHGFSTLQNASNYDNLYHAAVCRAQADWIIGLNITRALTCKFDTQLNAGRVQTPTLALLVNREKEINNFKSKDFWNIKIDFGKFVGLWQDANGSSRIFDREIALNLKRKLAKGTPKILEITRKKKSEKHPLAYDLTELQKDANIKYDLSAKQTLSAIQKLYERFKLVSYPRTDSKYITTDMKDTIPERLNAISKGVYKNQVNQIIQNGYELDKRFVDDSKVSDHHAILPTEVVPNYFALNESEKQVYHLIVKRFLTVLSPDYKYERINIKVKIADELFVATGKKIIDLGWKKITTDIDPLDIEDQNLISLSDKAKLETISINMKKNKTSPPSRFTEATLLEAMENPVKYLTQKDLKDAMKGGGLGTPATRADIIDKLIKKYYVERTGRSLQATSKASELMKLVPEQFKHPDLTAKWEDQLAMIEKGKISANDFMDSIKNNINDLVNEVKNSKLDYKPSNLTDQFCPRCGEYLMKVKKRGRNILVCSDRRCSFESTGELNNHLQTRPKYGRKHSASKITKEYQKSDGFDNGDSLGDLFDF